MIGYKPIRVDTVGGVLYRLGTPDAVAIEVAETGGKMSSVFVTGKSGRVLQIPAHYIANILWQPEVE